MPGAVRTGGGLPRTSVPGIAVSTRLVTPAEPRQAQQDINTFTNLNAAAEQRALHTVSDLTRKLEYVDRMSEAPVPLSVMREALSILDPATFDDLLVERHSVYNFCPYPPCPNKAATPYEPTSNSAALKRVRLKANGTLYAVERGAFCSNLCKARSSWFRDMLGTERVELLEDVEERRREVMRGATEMAVDDDLDSISNGGSSMQPPTAAMNNLRIVERETPTQPPLPPSDSNRASERPPSRKLPSTASASIPIRRPSATSSSQLSRSPIPPSQPFRDTFVLPSDDSDSASLINALLSKMGVPESARVPSSGPVASTSSRDVEMHYDDYEDEDEYDDDADREETKRLMAEALMVREMVRRGEL